jgi:glycosyltransferase involved in cell wall biosynthesis
LPFAQLQSLVDCCRAVQSIYDEGRSISLEIYTPLFLAGKFIKELQAGDSIILRDALTDDGAMFKILQEVDVVLLPVNFDQSSIRFIKYSMPTKIPSYLSAGAPILAYGPSEVAQISYALDSGWAYVVSVRDTKALKSGILKIINDYSLRKSLSKKAHKCAMKNHNLMNVKAVFHNYLINSIN